MKRFAREFITIAFVAIPLVQLYVLWPSIPETIPVHYNIDGTADRFDNKAMLLWFVPLVLVSLYVLLLVIPFIDPKKRISLDQSAYGTFRLLISLFLSMVLVTFLLTITGHWQFTKSIIPLTMAFIAVLGNYLPTVKPNYFVGIRTPWTLENEKVWISTHRFTGRLWVVTGLIGFILYVLMPTTPPWLGIGILIASTITAVVYSYVVYRDEKNLAKE